MHAAVRDVRSLVGSVGSHRGGQSVCAVTACEGCSPGDRQVARKEARCSQKEKVPEDERVKKTRRLEGQGCGVGRVAVEKRGRWMFDGLFGGRT